MEPTEREEGRHPIYESLVQHPVPETIRAAGLVKRATCHNVRHSVAWNLREAGYDMGPGQGLLRHQDRADQHVRRPCPESRRGARAQRN